MVTKGRISPFAQIELDGYFPLTKETMPPRRMSRQLRDRYWQLMGFSPRLQWLLLDNTFIDAPPRRELPKATASEPMRRHNGPNFDMIIVDDHVNMPPTKDERDRQMSWLIEKWPLLQSFSRRIAPISWAHRCTDEGQP